METAAGHLVALIHLVGNESARMTAIGPFLADPAKYTARLEADKPGTLNGCACRRGWKLQGKDVCASPNNGFCCNPNDDVAGPWCVTDGPCVGEQWDRCQPHLLRTHLLVHDREGALVSHAELTTDFTRGSPLDLPFADTLKLRPATLGEQQEPVAPLTKNGCMCAPPEEAEAGLVFRQCTKEDGFCCKGRDGAHDWCPTVGNCGGEDWDECTRASVNRALFREVSRSR